MRKPLWEQIVLEWRSLSRGEIVFLVLVGAALVAFSLVGPGGGLAVAGATLVAGFSAGIVIAAGRRRRSDAARTS